MKKITIFGGGTGMSTLLRGLKEFPVEITSIVSVCDDGRSTGKLRKEFNIPAIGDIRQVMVALSETEPLMEKLLNYRFETNSELNEHTVGNLLLTAGANITGNLSDGIEVISNVLNLKGKVVPFSEDNIVLMGKMNDGNIVEGEHNITDYPSLIEKVYYKSEPKVCKEVIQAIRESDLIILSMGSLYTSIIPNLLSDSIIEELDKSSAKLMYVCNMVTQPGETDNFKVSNHINALNSYLGNHKIDVVLVNIGKIHEEVAKKYSTLERKWPVILDENNIDCELICNNYVSITDDMLRHNVEKLSLDIYSYIVNND